MKVYLDEGQELFPVTVIETDLKGLPEEEFVEIKDDQYAHLLKLNADINALAKELKPVLNGQQLAIVSYKEDKHA